MATVRLSARDSHPIMPFVAVSAGLASFGTMDAVMKALSLTMDVYNALFWRCVVAVAMAALLFALRPTKLPRRATMGLHIKRASVTTVMAYTFFFGLARTPMAEAIAISFIAPLIALYLAAVLLGETIGRASILASLLGLAGVLVIAAGRLGQTDYDADAALGIASILLSACLYAWNLILQRQQAQVASPQEIALFQNGIVTGWLLLAFPFVGVWPAVQNAGMSDHIMLSAGLWPLIALGSLLSLASVLALSWGYARAEAQALLPVEYTMFLWAALLGWLLFAEPLGWSTLVGAVLIVAGCWLAARRNSAAVAA